LTTTTCAKCGGQKVQSVKDTDAATAGARPCTCDLVPGLKLKR
jgi:hypothetical protein